MMYVVLYLEDGYLKDEKAVRTEVFENQDKAIERLSELAKQHERTGINQCEVK